ncbi:BTB/POZ and TAZ domain-containing protein 1-like isoform X2 [Andrographis paniculata]|nr:BTB/POZ and TAZ domain-containing protein 1-like isoform X2 [Andrographis paniculata]
MEDYGIHLLALAHVYSVAQLKQSCSKVLRRNLNVNNVVDMLQLARLCDASDLYLDCMRLLSRHFKAVEASEGWKFLQNNDPYLELEILQFIDEAESRKKRRKRHIADNKLYAQLSEAMDCLEHICSEGCTSVGPYDMDPSKHKSPCSKFSTCQGIQLLIKHFGACKDRVNGGCSRCKRMWQLFKLHSSICDRPDECRVPLCRQFKLKARQDRGDALWRLLVRKVTVAKAMSSLSFLKSSSSTAAALK